MNGKPPAPPQVPPSVQRARQHAPRPGKRGWTGLWRTRIVAALVGLAVVAIVVAKVVSTMQTKTAQKASTESMMDPYWGRQTFQYKTEEAAPPPEEKKPVDTITPELAALRRQMNALQQELELLKQRKTTTTTVLNQGDKGGQRAPVVQRSAPAPTQFIAHALPKDQDGEKPLTPAYVLAPGTFLPCTVETKMNSEVEGYFTAKVNQNVYDSATHTRLLVPQGSTMLGHDNSSQLVYGNERMDTISVKLSFPDGRSVELGNAPVTDQEGVAGLTGDVDQHYWRLFGAVFIGGALKGGMQAMQTAMIQGAGAGQVASGIATYGNQATSRVVGRALDTRPTIKVYAGQLCHVLLTKELKLPAMWQ
jgi:type IV secretory pathway VirB10-like protein